MGQSVGDTVLAPGAPNVQVFAASDTWNKPDGIRAAMVEVVGGGGGSGGVALTGASQASASPGAGGGGYSRKLIQAADLGATEVVTIGAGGTGGAAGANNGVAGGTSSFGSHCSATGGSLSLGASAVTPPILTGVGGAGGSGVGGDVNIQGSRGGFCIAFAGSVARANGGSSHLSGTEPGGSTSSGVDGAAGETYGGGAHGAANAQNQVAGRPGAAGASGVVIVTTYF